MIECGMDITWRLTSKGLAGDEGHEEQEWSNKQAREMGETGIVWRL